MLILKSSNKEHDSDELSSDDAAAKKKQPFRIQSETVIVNRIANAIKTGDGKVACV